MRVIHKHPFCKASHTIAFYTFVFMHALLNFEPSHNHHSQWTMYFRMDKSMMHAHAFLHADAKDNTHLVEFDDMGVV